MTANNDILQGSNAKYRLLELLGEGLTARVYKAEVLDEIQAFSENRLVAIKILKPGLEKDVISQFVQEAQNLNEVDTALKKWREEYGKRFPPATPPFYYELVTPDNTFSVEKSVNKNAGGSVFMVMELMQARQLEAILHGKRGRFSESEGLRIGIQLFGLFQALHEYASRTYTDFKFENLWVEPDGRIRVTDWNVLSEHGDLAGIPTDLERGARALIRILTGVPIPPDRRLEKQPHFEGLSIGVQRLLRRILHKNRNLRPASALDIRYDLIRLLEYWEKPVSEISLRRIRGVIEGAKAGKEKKNISHEDFVATLLREQDRLGVLLQRRELEHGSIIAGWSENFVHELEFLYRYTAQLLPTPEDMVASAIDLMKANSIAAARQGLEKVCNDNPEHILAHRWLAIADAIGDGSWDYPKERLIALNQLHKHPKTLRDYQNLAIERFSRYLPDVVRGDIEVHLKVLEAIQFQQGGKLSLALEKIQEASDRLNDIVPLAYRNAIYFDLPIDLESYGKELEKIRRKKEYQNSKEKILRHINDSHTCESKMTDCSQVLQLVQVLVELRDDPEVIEAVMNLGKRCLRNGKFLCAKKIFAVGAALDDDNSVRYRDLWQIAHAAYLLHTSPTAPTTDVEVSAALETLQRERNELLQDEFSKLLLRPHRIPWLSRAQIETIINALWRKNTEDISTVVLTKLCKSGKTTVISETMMEIASIKEMATWLQQKIMHEENLSSWEAHETAKILAKGLLKLIPASLKKPGSIAELYQLSGLLFQIPDDVVKALASILADWVDPLTEAQESEKIINILAKSVGIPSNVALIKELIRDIPSESERRRLAKDYYRMLSQLDSEKYPPGLLYQPKRYMGDGTISRSDSQTQVKTYAQEHRHFILSSHNPKDTVEVIDVTDESTPTPRHRVSVGTSEVALASLSSAKAPSEEMVGQGKFGIDSQIHQIVEQSTDLAEMRDQLAQLKATLSSQQKEQVDALIDALPGFGKNFYDWLGKMETEEQLTVFNQNKTELRMKELESVIDQAPWNTYATLKTVAFASTYHRLQALVKDDEKKDGAESEFDRKTLAQHDIAPPNDNFDPEVKKTLDRLLNSADSFLDFKKQLASETQKELPKAIADKLTLLHNSLAMWNQEFIGELDRLIDKERINAEEAKYVALKLREWESLVNKTPWKPYAPLESPIFADIYHDLEELKSNSTIQW